MLAWVAGAFASAGALCVAALLAEQATRARRRPGRYLWIAAMALSILLPVLGPWLPASTSGHLPLLQMPLAGAAPALGLLQFNELGPPVWLALSVASLLLLWLGAALVQWRSRTWRRTKVGELEVYLSIEAGPAVFGLWKPRIVLPEWLSRAPPRQRELAIAHEQSHLLARDPQLLACALVLVSIMPWNLLLWWQLHRLRRAIEVDCDERVLRAGGDLVDYGETLIELSQHQPRLAGLMAATSVPRSFLERRIQIMSAEMSRWSRLSAALWLCLAVGAVGVAAELAPPPASAAPSVAGSKAPDSTSADAAKVEAEIAAARAREAKQHAERVVDAREAEPALDAEDAGEAEAAEEAESAAQEAMHEADEQMTEANEAMHDAETQRAEATVAKREAEAAEAEARAKKQAAEAAAKH